jgi:hypothetical protein
MSIRRVENKKDMDLPTNEFRQENPTISSVKIQVPYDLTLDTSFLDIFWIQDWTGIAVAGPHVRDAVNQRVHGSKSQVDIFLVSEPNVKIDQIWIQEKVIQMYSWLREYYNVNPILDLQGSYVRFSVPDISSPTKRTALSIQVIVSHTFPSIEKVLLSFENIQCRFGIQRDVLSATRESLRYVDVKRSNKFKKNGSRPYRKESIDKDS